MHQKGMTLVELLVVVVVAAIIGIAVINMFIASNRTFMDQNKVIDVQRDGRLVMEYITKTLREARLNPLNSPDFQGIRANSLTSITIDRDSDLDGVLDSDSEIVSFKIRTEPDGEKILMRGFNEGLGNERWQDVARNITGFSLAYFNETGATAATNAEIRSIDVTITFTDSKLLGGDFTRSYKTRIDLRNF